MGEQRQERSRDQGGNRVCDASGPPDSIGPVRAQERIVTLDILRGIALLGVLIANVYLWFNGLWFLFPEYGEELMRFSLDSVAFHGITAFVEGKAITTFSFLFGLGFALQMTRAEAKGGHFVPFFSRRMAILFLIGVPHGVLLWYGDILMAYALIGLLLLLFRNARDRTLLMWAGGLLVAVPLVLGVLGWWVAAAGLQTLGLPQDTAILEGFRSSDVATAVALLISLAVFAVQILWSHWWLTHFRFGPLEWLWRMATYGKLQPMRIPAAVQPTATGP